MLEQKASLSREKLSRQEEQSAALKRQSVSRRRRVLSPEILRSLLPLRLATVEARAAWANAVTDEARLKTVSAAYREALARLDEATDNLVRTDLQGATWWVPVPASLTGAARDRFLAKQRFPYRNISQTREFALGPILLDIGANTGRMSIPRVILGDVTQAVLRGARSAQLCRAGTQRRRQPAVGPRTA